MNKEIALKILDVQEKVMNNANYKKLLEEFRQYDEKMRSLYATLSKEQLDVLMGYLGVGAELHLYLLEIACRKEK